LGEEMKVAVEISPSKRVLQDHFLSLEASFFLGGGVRSWQQNSSTVNYMHEWKVLKWV